MDTIPDETPPFIDMTENDYFMFLHLVPENLKKFIYEKKSPVT